MTFPDEVQSALEFTEDPTQRLRRLDDLLAHAHCLASYVREQAAQVEELTDDLRIMTEVRQHGCDCSDDEACQFVRERNAARAELAELKGRTCDACAEQDRDAHEVPYHSTVTEPTCTLTKGEDEPCGTLCSRLGNTCGAWKERTT